MKLPDSGYTLLTVLAVDILATVVVFFHPSLEPKLFELYEISIGGLYGTYQLQQKNNGE
jgi:hypothetical protein